MGFFCPIASRNWAAREAQYCTAKCSMLSRSSQLPIKVMHSFPQLAAADKSCKTNPEMAKHSHAQPIRPQNPEVEASYWLQPSAAQSAQSSTVTLALLRSNNLPHLVKAQSRTVVHSQMHSRWKNLRVQIVEYIPVGCEHVCISNRTSQGYIRTAQQPPNASGPQIYTIASKAHWYSHLPWYCGSRSKAR